MKKRCYFLIAFLLTAIINITAIASIDLINTYFKNPVFLNSDPTVLGQVNINHCEFDAIKELEIRERIIQILRTYSLFSKCDRMFLLWLSMVLKNTSEGQVINDWRNMVRNHGYSEVDCTVLQHQILNLPDSEILQLYRQVQKYMERIEPEVTQELIIRVLKRHQWHDKHQINAIPLRSLPIVQNRKINITLLKDCRNIIKKVHEDNLEIPICEQVKNFKIFHINDFYASKGSLVVHDIFDHLWFATKLEEEGIFSRYEKLWESIGSPQLYDIFSREGELFASIAFDFRSFQSARANHFLLFTISDIKKILQKSIDSNITLNNQQRALELVESADQDSIFLKGLIYIVNGMAVELLELNRKAGYIKILDEVLCPKGYFNFFDPEHIAFIVEAVHFLFKNNKQHTQIVTNISLMIEKYLTEILINGNIGTLVIGLEEIKNLQNLDLLVIPERRIKWIRDHVGFEAIRHSLVN